MVRLACIHLQAFPLQLLLKRRRGWSHHPVAVVAEDKPQGEILWVNGKARSAGIFPGLRYAAGFSLDHRLRAGAVSPAEIGKETTVLLGRLARFSPQVEPNYEEPGILWLGLGGMKLLHSSLQAWAREVRADIEAQGFRGSVAVGFTRFGTYAAAKAQRGTVIFDDASKECAAAREIPLNVLDLAPDLRDALFKLGIKTVGSFLSLPRGGIYQRLGAEAYRLYRMASGELWTPLQPHEIENPVREKVLLDEPETDATRLLFLIKRLLHPMLSALAAKREALAELRMAFLIDRRGWRSEQVRPAAPILDSIQLSDLLRLRLETIEFAAGVVEIELTAGAVPATSEQLRLFAEQPKRDLNAGNRALARLRAEFGDEAVVRAKLADGHLPEARFTWEPLDRVKLPRPPLNSPGSKVLVRRILAKPSALPSRERTHDDGWLVLGPKFGPVERLSGPYVFSGGWWNREIHREYYFAETRRGDLLWLYYDRVRRKWFLQGWVE